METAQLREMGLCKSQSNKNKDRKNPWDYKTELPVLLEGQKLDRDEVSVLCC